MTELRPGTYDSFYTMHGDAGVHTEMVHITADPESRDRKEFWARSEIIRDGNFTLRSVHLALGNVGIEGEWVEYGVEGVPRMGKVTFYPVEQAVQGDRGDMYYGTWGLHGERASGAWVLCARTAIGGATD